MNWTFLNTGFNTGKFNMDYDLNLAGNCSDGNAYFRIYRWNPYCISYGANQDIQSLDAPLAQINNIDIVQRPTGGRAILHSEEITYSVVLPLGHQTSARGIYNDINSALLIGLRLYDNKLSGAALENSQPDFPEFYKKEIGAVCFAVSAKSEIKFNGKKLVGSAQRKMSNAILQHGSILCGSYHTKIAGYLNLPADKKKDIFDEVNDKTTDIEAVINKPVDYEDLSECIFTGFQQYFNIKPIRISLDESLNGKFIISKEVKI